MYHQQQKLTTVALPGANTLLDCILVQLLEDEGYDTHILDAYRFANVDQRPEPDNEDDSHPRRRCGGRHNALA